MSDDLGPPDTPRPTPSKPTPKLPDHWRDDSAPTLREFLENREKGACVIAGFRSHQYPSAHLLTLDDVLLTSGTLAHLAEQEPKPICEAVELFADRVQLRLEDLVREIDTLRTELLALGVVSLFEVDVLAETVAEVETGIRGDELLRLGRSR